MVSKKKLCNFVLMFLLVFPIAACGESDLDKLTKVVVNNSNGTLGKPVAICIAKAILDSDELSDETKKKIINFDLDISEDDKYTLTGIYMGQMGNTDC